MWSRDLPVAETSLWQHTTITIDRPVLAEEFEPAIPASESPQTQPFDDVVFGFGLNDFIPYIILHATDIYHLL